MDKKLIIGILVIVIAAALLVFAIRGEESENGEIVNDNDVETSDTPVDLPVYPEAEVVLSSDHAFGGYTYYSVDASPADVSDFYREELPDFDFDKDDFFGYFFYNTELGEYMPELEYMSEEEAIAWVTERRGEILLVGVFLYEPGLDPYLTEEHEEDLEGKTIIIIHHL